MNAKEKKAWAKSMKERYNNGTDERPDYTDPKTGICFSLQYANSNLECYCKYCALKRMTNAEIRLSNAKMTQPNGSNTGRKKRLPYGKKR